LTGVRPPAGILLAAFLIVLSVVGCGGGDETIVGQPPSGPRAFADESYAELASDGKRGLWMAVAGYDRQRDFGLRLFRKQGSGWAPLPPPSGRVSPDLPISIAMAGGKTGLKPCLGYSNDPGRLPVVSCWARGHWARKPLPKAESAQLLQLAGNSGDLVALLLEQPSPRVADYRVLRFHSNRWSLEGPPVSAPTAVARLAVNLRPGRDSPAIGVTTQTARAERYVLGLDGQRWRRVGPVLRGLGIGPMVGGPVITQTGALFPVTQADVVPWSFSAHALPVESSSGKSSGKRLSVGAGNAQGRLDVASDEIWATWQEDTPLRDGRFRVGIFAAQLKSDGSVKRRIELWRGISIGPGSTQVVDFQGRRLALYMPSSSNGRGLQARVRTLP
jgi:hypothetical protein